MTINEEIREALYNCKTRDATCIDCNYCGDMCGAELAIEKLTPHIYTTADFLDADLGYLEYKNKMGIYPVLINHLDISNYVLSIIFRDKTSIILDLYENNLYWRIWNIYPSPKDREWNKWRVRDE